jgi:hypothetical protein
VNRRRSLIWSTKEAFHIHHKHGLRWTWTEGITSSQYLGQLSEVIMNMHSDLTDITYKAIRMFCKKLGFWWNFHQFKNLFMSPFPYRIPLSCIIKFPFRNVDEKIKRMIKSAIRDVYQCYSVLRIILVKRNWYWHFESYKIEIWWYLQWRKPM